MGRHADATHAVQHEALLYRGREHALGVRKCSSALLRQEQTNVTSVRICDEGPAARSPQSARALGVGRERGPRERREEGVVGAQAAARHRAPFSARAPPHAGAAHAMH